MAHQKTLTQGQLDAWLQHAGDLAKDGVGFLHVETDMPLADQPGVTRFLDSNQGVTYLGHLTDEVLCDRGKVLGLLEKACVTRRGRGALYASTPLALPLLYGSEVDPAEPDQLDVPALVARSELAYLLEAACVTSLISGAQGVAYLTPIEVRMAEALEDAGVAARAQATVGRRRVDFLVEDPVTGGRLAVECDGAAFHDPAEDATRDRELEELGVLTIRFTGSAIFRDAAACALRVKEKVGESRQAFEANDTSATAAVLRLSGLQMRAVNHRSGPARVAAPAGSGKTRVVDHRVRALVESGVDPSRICALSYTNAAVDEMRERLETSEADYHFATVHKLAKDVAEARFGRKTNVQGITPERVRKTPSRWGLLRGLLDSEERRMNRPHQFWPEAVSQYRQSFEVPRFDDWPGKTIPTDDRFLEICRGYDQLLCQRNLTDFEGFIHDALRALASDAEFRAIWSGRFDYWIVDEYQDLPKAKLWFLRLLVAPARNLFVVGDDDQVIFEFAGASGAIFTDFVEQFPDACEYALDRNYRSPHDLVVRSGWMIARNEIRVEKNMTADRELEEPDQVTLSRDQKYDRVGEQFIQDKLDAGCPPEEIAVLFRLRDMAIPLERLLRERGIPFHPCANPSFFASRPVKAMCAWLGLTSGQAIDSGLNDLTLRWPNRYMRNEQREALVEHLLGITDMGSLTKAAIDFGEANFNEQGVNAVTEWANALSDIPRGLKPTEILSRLGLRELAKNDVAPMGTTSPVVLFDVFFRIAAQFKSSQDLLSWISQHADDADYEQSVEQGVAFEPGRVTLATIHQAKGKEWDHVAVLGPPDSMPDDRARSDDQKEEERRIAYVAFTRARESVLFGGSSQYAEELWQREDGFSWEDYKAGKTEPSKPNRWDPWKYER